MVALPSILHEAKYKKFWKFDEAEPWKPVPTPDAPEEVKDAISEWLEALEDDGDDDTIVFD